MMLVVGKDCGMGVDAAKTRGRGRGNCDDESTPSEVGREVVGRRERGRDGRIKRQGK